MKTSAMYDKPFKTYDELLDLLESRNVVIDDRKFAIKCLSDISYYAMINGYKDLYPMSSNDKFEFPIPFFEFFSLYNVDIFLNSIILKYIITVEKSLKSKLSYTISKHYGIFTDLNDCTNKNEHDYLCKLNYRNTYQTQSVLKNIKIAILESKDESIKHYKNVHNHIPCWILINGIPFGMAIKWYEILTPEDKLYICDQIIQSPSLSDEQKKEFLKKALAILKKYRNNIAHGHKIFINSIKEELPKNQVLIISNNLITNKDYKKGIGRNDIFAVIVIISTLLDKTYSNMFLSEVIGCLDMFNEGVYSSGKSILEMLSLPNDFINKLEQMKSIVK